MKHALLATFHGHLKNPTKEVRFKGLNAQEVAENFNETTGVNTVKRIKTTLNYSFNLQASFQTLLRDLHCLDFKHRKGKNFNVLHDKPCNVEYKHDYVNKRLMNANNKDHPIQPEVFLDESYCHVDRHTEKSWSKKDSKKRTKGRQEMVVMFGAFVVHRNGRKLDAKMIEESIKFENLFEELCVALVPFGNCIIHMNGASYHKRRFDARPAKSKNKGILTTWLANHGVPLQDIPTSGKSPKKAELVEAVEKVEVDTQFNTVKITNKYGHKVMFTPPYHPEFQPIEKVWAIVKQPVAYDPDPNESVVTLRRKIGNSLSVTKSQLVSVYTKCINKAKDVQRVEQSRSRSSRNL
ncbi:hypothetical protein K501DRAFT_330756 [Backusella circina FSU 941]|nr:hypothetical protein K501DRAFT_330756 [Backusella circina FSU 941]